ncbi:hypothetical protein [Scleromatobacter humisilvae]|uniref:Uncharacterized protein n=1 Tax=Scleromatobacter humisilvae TaxID=2897159 RepID=A0A9X2C2B0_9BURK|nr:hypothetical protein [Scleromatobacter humisilvae]MCK9688516.1 hypothetical protein [Scleromatobacter humisilvae]
MHCRSTPLQTLALACALLFAGASQAAPKPLSDAEMSAVRGADGSILAGVQTPSSNAQNPFANGLSAAFSSSTGATLLTPSEFSAALAGVGLTPSMLSDYAGQTVSQTVVDAKPVTFSFNISDVLQSTTGLQYNSGPSMGTITLKDFDARGTTIWVWHHN